MCEDELGHKSCSEHIPIELWSRWSRNMEDSIGQSVVNGFLLVELCRFKDSTKMVCSDL